MGGADDHLRSGGGQHTRSAVSNAGGRAWRLRGAGGRRRGATAAVAVRDAAPICDAANRKAVFLLLGSASWDVVRGISETLAGRVLFVDVGGFSLAEVGAEHQNSLWLRGGFPRAWLAPSAAAWRRWMQSFTRTFLERDIPGLGAQVPAEALSRFWRMLAHCHGQVWNAAELGRSMDAGARTVNRYRDLLAGTFMVRVLPPWFENLGKRLVKSPKVYLRDSGILHALLDLHDMPSVRLHRATAPAGRASRWNRRCSSTASATPTSMPRNGERSWTCCCATGALGLRVQVYGRAAHSEVDARRFGGPGAGAPLHGVPGQPALPVGRWHHRAALQGDGQRRLARGRALVKRVKHL